MSVSNVYYRDLYRDNILLRMYRFDGRHNDNEADSVWDDFQVSANTCIEWRTQHVRWLTKLQKIINF